MGIYLTVDTNELNPAEWMFLTPQTLLWIHALLLPLTMGVAILVLLRTRTARAGWILFSTTVPLLLLTAAAYALNLLHGLILTLVPSGRAGWEDALALHTDTTRQILVFALLPTLIPLLLSVHRIRRAPSLPPPPDASVDPTPRPDEGSAKSHPPAGG